MNEVIDQTDPSTKSGIANQVKSAFITHGVFVLLNIAIVLTGIFLPRVINQPRIVVEAVNTHFDEEEHVIDPDTLFKTRGLVINNGLTYACSEHFRYGIVPSHCSNELKAEAKVQITRLEGDIMTSKEDEAYYSRIAFLDKEELIQELSSDRIKDRENSAVLSAVLLEDYAKPEFEGLYLQQLTSIIRSSVAQNIRQKESDLEAVKELLASVSTIDKTNLARSGDLEIEFIVSNQGYADAIATSNGTLFIDGVEVPLISLKKIQYGTDEKGSYTIIPSKDVVRLTYIVDAGAVSENGREVLDRAVASKTASSYNVTIEVGGTSVRKSSNFSTKTRSLDRR